MKNITLKQGAMFGMDARIALTMFSIIGLVGAYFINDKVDSMQEQTLVQQVDTLRNAARQNIADNGYDYNISDSQANDNIFNLNENSSANDLMRGRNNNSYIEVPNNKSTANVINIQTPARLIEVDSSNMYAAATESGASASVNDCASNSADCFYFIRLSNVDNASFKLLEEHYDGSTTGFSNSTDRSTGLIVAQGVNLSNDTATVYVRIGSRR